MKISVIVPVYNVCDYLEKCLNSLVNQTDNDFEVIIVNDGSTDNSQEIIEKYCNNYSNFYSFSKKNGGQASARNFGLNKATGDYVLFLDSDDYYESNTIEKLKKQALDNDIVVFRMFIDNGSDIVKYNIDLPSAIADNNILTSKKLLLYNPSPCDKMFKRELFSKNNISFVEGKYYEDLGTIPLFAMKTDRIKFIDDYLYHYVTRTDSTMNKINYNSKIEDIFYIVNYIYDSFKENNLYDSFEKEIEYIYIHHLLRAASIRFINYEKYDMVDRVVKTMKEKFPNFYKNQYFKIYGFKRKLMCWLIYNRRYKMIKLLRRI